MRRERFFYVDPRIVVINRPVSNRRIKRTIEGLYEESYFDDLTPEEPGSVNITELVEL
jgi:hypothetical protein